MGGDYSSARSCVFLVHDVSRDVRRYGAYITIQLAAWCADYFGIVWVMRGGGGGGGGWERER